MKHPIIINSNGELVRRPRSIVGFKVKEMTGFAIVNPRGIANATKSVIVGK